MNKIISYTRFENMPRYRWLENIFSNLEKKLYPDLPEYASLDDWQTYRNKQKEKKVYYFLTNTLDDIIKYYVFYPYNLFYSLKMKFKYNFMPSYKYHIIHTRLKPDYYDLDTRLLHGIFESLVDFVECEKAWLQIVFGEDKHKRKWYHRWKKIRSSELGLKYLEWETTLESNNDLNSLSQSDVAREIIFLYNWWKEVYLKRECPYEMFLHLDKTKDINCSTDISIDETLELKKDYHDAINDEEKRRYDEEQEMLIRLIKLRNNLWS